MRELGHVRRQNDWIRILGLFVGVGTIGGMAWALCAYPLKWSGTSARMDILEPVVWQNKSDIRDLKIIEAKDQDEIVHRLVRIENKIDNQRP